ncbi:hypothetical protein JYA63_07095 [Fictibacillus nanhaiensis]|uniref:FAD/NAD(P)-binding domain-containing protein n=1 Tax=Fictibacillus nanhaiensis TaxID=742169 RepID=A0ABS2ZRR2_9BACL|nr:hypothetical protein [Fictibacillus nanhaiensis]
MNTMNIRTTIKETNNIVQDLVIIGGGFRTTTFLSSDPNLLKDKVMIIEQETNIGPGAFKDYNILTSSSGTSMLKYLTFEGPFERLLMNHKVTAVSQNMKPVRAEKLASALIEIGLTIEAELGDNAIRRSTSVEKIQLGIGNNPVSIYTNQGDIVKAKHVLLATGRYERINDELLNWNKKLMLSNTVIRHSKKEMLQNKLLTIGERPIVIAGSSHSAMSVLSCLLEIMKRLKDRDTRYIIPPIYVLQRSKAYLMYDNEEEARKEQIMEREMIYDPLTDVCPDTGIVYRDSGLRHQSKELYCSLWSGEIKNVSIVNIKKLSDVANLLDQAGLVIQALGYFGNAPDIFLCDRLIRPSNSLQRIEANEEGAAIINKKVFDNLSVLRLEPTPLLQKDNMAYGSSLYHKLSSRIKRKINEAQELVGKL